MIEQISKTVKDELERAPAVVHLPPLSFHQRMLLGKLNLSSLYGQWRLWLDTRRENRRKYVWRGYAYYGAGLVITPCPMREAQAIAWVARTTRGSVMYVDRQHHFIFYKLSV